MNTFKIFLYKKGVLKFNANKIQKWVKEGKSNHLIIALQLGLYDIRKLSVEGLAKLQHIDAIPSLINALDDSVKTVSDASMEALQSLTKKDDQEINQKIKAKQSYWKNKKNEVKKGSYISNLSFGQREKESPSQRLEKRFKQQRDTNHPPFGF